ncbi:hypothetical protein ABMY12_05240, partial [Vibrio vulnificus]|uniref:hypothetical protein n=2 Tax=Vibrio vulnificus TaxID=672 RepID=UPI0040588C41
GPFCNVLVVENGGWNASPIEFLFTDHFKKACCLAGFRRFSFRQSLLTDVEPRGVRLTLEYDSSPAILRKGPAVMWGLFAMFWL